MELINYINILVYPLTGFTTLLALRYLTPLALDLVQGACIIFNLGLSCLYYYELVISSHYPIFFKAFGWLLCEMEDFSRPFVFFTTAPNLPAFYIYMPIFSYDPLAALLLSANLCVALFRFCSFLSQEPYSESSDPFAYLSFSIFYLIVLATLSNFIPLFLGWEFDAGPCPYILTNLWQTTAIVVLNVFMLMEFDIRREVYITLYSYWFWLRFIVRWVFYLLSKK